MALKDALAVPPKEKRQNKVADWRASLDEEDRQAFDAAVADTSRWPDATLARTLSAAGFPVTGQTIMRWRESLR